MSLDCLDARYTHYYHHLLSDLIFRQSWVARLLQQGCLCRSQTALYSLSEPKLSIFFHYSFPVLIIVFYKTRVLLRHQER